MDRSGDSLGDDDAHSSSCLFRSTSKDAFHARREKIHATTSRKLLKSMLDHLKVKLLLLSLNTYKSMSWYALL